MTKNKDYDNSGEEDNLEDDSQPSSPSKHMRRGSHIIIDTSSIKKSTINNSMGSITSPQNQMRKKYFNQ